MQSNLFNENEITDLEKYVTLSYNEKIEKAIEIIKKGEKLALNINNEGFHVAFSGGKDSIVLYDLFKKSGCKGEAYFYNTQLEEPEIPIFIRKNYPEIKFLYPEKTFYQLLEKECILPTRMTRFCCKYLKEGFGYGSVVLMGITIFESNRRKKQNVDFLKQFCGAKSKEKEDKITLSPILHFTEANIYKYIKENNLILPNFYKLKKRSGCIGCPMNTKKANDLKNHPKLLKAWKWAISKSFNKDKSKFESVEDMFKWWFSNKSIKDYLLQKKQTNLF